MRRTVRAARAATPLAALLAVLALLAPAAASGAQRAPERLPAASWLLVDADSGDVLAAHDPKRARPIASATKLMTAHIALRALRPNDEVVAPPYEAGPLESLMGLRPGDRVTVRDLLYGLLLASGNDAAQALAIRVAGSVPDFVRRMNRAAGTLGLHETEFADPIGLGAGNVASARDLVALAQELREVSLFRKIVDTPKVALRLDGRRKRIVNRNNLVREVPWVSGIKTGSTLAAGYVLVASAERRGVPFVSAVLGAPGEEERDAATLELLRYGASLYERRKLVRRGELVATLDLGERGSLALVAGAPVEHVARADQRPQVRFDPPEPPAEAIARGEELGTAAITLDGRVVARVPVVAERAVPEEASSGLPGWALAVLAAAAIAAIVLGARAVALARRRQ